MSNPPARGATWADGQAYEAYMGRWSAALAPRFLGLLGPEPGWRWLDVGCGTGILTRAILVETAPASVVGIDPSRAVRGPRSGDHRRCSRILPDRDRRWHRSR